MLKDAFEAAALIGIVVAVIAGCLYALGTVAHISYYEALGFDAHQFPAVGLEIQVLGSVYGALPFLVVSIVVAGFVYFYDLIKVPTEKIVQAPSYLRYGVSIIGVMMLITFYWLKGLPDLSLGQILCIVLILIFLCPLLFQYGFRVIIVAMTLFLIARLSLVIMDVVSRQAYAVGKAKVEKAGKSNAVTIVELKDGSRMSIPGLRVVCSERFCGFNDGKTATLIALKDVHSMQSPVPQDTAAPGK